MHVRSRSAASGESDPGTDADTVVDVLIPPSRGLLTSTVVSHLAVGVGHVLMLTQNRGLFAWGQNVKGQCAHPPSTMPFLNEPVQVSLRSRESDRGGSGTAISVLSVAAGGDASLAQLSSGEIWQWGVRFPFLSTQRRCNHEPIPVLTCSPQGRLVVGAEGRSYYVLISPPPGGSTTTMHVWGENNYGQLGDNTRIDRKEPVKVVVRPNLRKLSVCGRSVLGLTTEGGVVAFGEHLVLESYGSNTYSNIRSVRCFSSPVTISVRLNSGGLVAKSAEFETLEVVDVVCCYGGAFFVTSSSKIYRCLAFKSQPGQLAFSRGGRLDCVMLGEVFLPKERSVKSGKRAVFSIRHTFDSRDCHVYCLRRMV